MIRVFSCILFLCCIYRNILALKFNPDGSIDKLNYAQMGVIKNKDHSTVIAVSGYNSQIILGIRKSNVLQDERKPILLFTLPLSKPNEKLFISLVGERSDCNAMKTDIIAIYDDYYSSHNVYLTKNQLALAIADTIHDKSLGSSRPLRCNVLITSSASSSASSKAHSSLSSSSPAITTVPSCLMIDLSGNIFESKSGFISLGYFADKIMNWYKTTTAIPTNTTSSQQQIQQQQRVHSELSKSSTAMAGDKSNTTSISLQQDQQQQLLLPSKTLLNIRVADYNIDYYNLVHVCYKSVVEYLNNKLGKTALSNNANEREELMKKFLPQYLLLASLVTTTATTNTQLVNSSTTTSNSSKSLYLLNHTKRHALHHNQMKYGFDLLWDCLTHSNLGSSSSTSDGGDNNNKCDDEGMQDFPQQLRVGNYTLEVASISFESDDSNSSDHDNDNDGLMDIYCPAIIPSDIFESVNLTTIISSSNATTDDSRNSINNTAADSSNSNHSISNPLWHWWMGRWRRRVLLS